MTCRCLTYDGFMECQAPSRHSPLKFPDPVENFVAQWASSELQAWQKKVWAEIIGPPKTYVDPSVLQARRTVSGRWSCKEPNEQRIPQPSTGVVQHHMWMGEFLCERHIEDLPSGNVLRAAMEYSVRNIELKHATPCQDCERIYRGILGSSK